MRASWATSVAHEIAKYSFGIYLTHVPILWIWLRAIPSLPTAARWLGVAASLIVMPVVLYRVIEHPMTNLGRQLAGDRQVPVSRESRLEEQTSAP